MKRQSLSLTDSRVACPACGKKQTSLLNEEKGEYEWVCDLCGHSFQTDLDYKVIQAVPTIEEPAPTIEEPVPTDKPIYHEEPVPTEEPLHTWFGLSYASYLTLPRSLLEAMPAEWQKRFVLLLGEMEAEFPVSWPPEGHYRVSLVGPRNRFLKDALAEYRRPDRFLIESLRRKDLQREGQAGYQGQAGYLGTKPGYLGNINGPGCDPDTV